MTIANRKRAAEDKQLEKKVRPPQNLETKTVETKSTGNEVANAFEDFMRAFESYKETNDERLAQVEQRIGTDVVTTEKMDRISRSMDEQKRKLDQLMVKGSRPVLGDRSVDLSCI
jgi:predicted phage gp36 major capsid-like protein